MHRPPREISVLPVTLAVTVLALLMGLLGARFSGGGPLPLPRDVHVTVSARSPGRPLPAGFLGLSMEYSAIEAYAGRDAASPDPVFEQLVRNLAPGQRPVLRIGGDSADWAWWPVAGMARPPGVSFTLDDNWVAVAHRLAGDLNARLLLGLNLEADSGVLAATEERELLAGLGANAITAFELGNEPALYGTFAWYRTASGKGVPGRPASYGFDSYLQDFTRVSAALPSYPLAGPTTGGDGWIPYLARFLATEPRVRLVTVHRYPLQLCLTSTRSPRYPTLAHLLAPGASTGLADGFSSEVTVAHSRGLPLRIDELNSVSCGAAPAVSQTFAAALWALDALFELDRVGVDGVNVHTFPGAGYQLFRLSQSGGRWSASVAPEYYGLMLFAAAAPPGSRLLPVAAPASPLLKVWATQAPDHRIRVVLINKDGAHGHLVELRLPGGAGRASVQRLQAPSLSATADATLAGQRLGSDGRLSGARTVSRLAPHAGVYEVALPPGSAALLTAD